MKNNNILIILALIIILGAGLQLFNLNKKNLCYDETSSIAHACKDFNIASQRLYNYKPVYTFLLKGWIGIFGAGLLPGRLLTVLFGISSIFLIFKIGESLVNAHVGLISSFILSISSFYIYYSQEIKYHVFLMFLIMLSFWYFINLLNKQGLRCIVINLILNILILYTHPYGYLAICVQFFYIILNYRSIEKSKLKKWLGFQSYLLLALGLSFSIMLKGKHYFESILWWAKPPGIQGLVETFTTFCYGGPKYGTVYTVTKTCPIVTRVILIFIYGSLFIKGLIIITREKSLFKFKGAGNFIIIWLLLPIISAFLFSYIFFSAYFIKQLLICLPAFYLIIAMGIYFKNRPTYILHLLLIIFLLNIMPLKILYKNIAEVDWSKVVSLMKQQNLKNDAIIVIGTCKEIIPFIYYLSNADKKVFKDISMFGKLRDGKWQEVFWYKKHYIVTIASERNQPEGIVRLFHARYNNYSCANIISEFDSKFFRKDILNTDKQVWVLLSRWLGVKDDCLHGIINKIRKYFNLKFENEVGEVKVFCFEPIGL